MLTTLHHYQCSDSSLIPVNSTANLRLQGLRITMPPSAESHPNVGRASGWLGDGFLLNNPWVCLHFLLQLGGIGRNSSVIIRSIEYTVLVKRDGS